jgi:prepilin-type N-terminal cleavage/methylation domain-containing protein
MKRAFTMIELVFVIIIVGIISVMIAPSFQGNRLRQAADQVVSHIRYTQHLAMMDNKFSTADVNWYRHRWQMVFNSDGHTYNKEAYTIFHDDNENGNPNLTTKEVAINPLDPNKYLTGGYSNIIYTDGVGSTQSMNLGMEYGVTSVLFSSTCKFAGSKRISFDYLGRPLKGSPRSFSAPYQFNRLIVDDCNITLTDGVDNIVIQIKPETGYTHIL